MFSTCSTIFLISLNLLLLYCIYLSSIYLSIYLSIIYLSIFMDCMPDVCRNAHPCREPDRLGGSCVAGSGRQAGLSCQLGSFSSLHKLRIVCPVWRPVLSGVRRRLAMDFRHCRVGFPDLVVWSPQSHRVKLLEVKDPGNSLSQKKVTRLDQLRRQVCHLAAVRAESRGPD